MSDGRAWVGVPLGVAAAGLLVACGTGASGEGAAGAPCYPNATCGPGLVCDDGICVAGEVEPSLDEPPAVELVRAPPPVTRETEALFEMTCAPAPCHLRCRLGEEAEGPCVSPLVIGRLPDGEHTLTVRGLSAGGLAGDPLVHTWQVDTVAPELAFTGTPPERTAVTEATFDLACSKDDCRTECSLDGAARSPCTFPHGVSDLADGLHVFEVVAFDPAGNPSAPVTHAWEVDTRPPIVSFLGPLPEETTADALELSFACDKPACTVFCSLDGAEPSACESPHAIGGLPIGGHTLTIFGEDDLGTRGPEVSVAWRVVPDRWVHLSAGPSSTCGVRLDGSLWCWGRPFGELGAVPAEAAIPTRVGERNDWVEVSVGSHYACALDQGGGAWCWGENGEGVLGDGTTERRDEPVRAGGEQLRFSTVRASWGSRLTCAVGEGGEGLWCWGGRVDSDWYGYSPMQLAAGGWRVLSMGGSSIGNACAIRDDGTLWCFGDNWSGQVGLGTRSQSVRFPARVGEADEWDDWEDVAVGTRHACGLRDGGRIWCWGHNAAGQLGDGTEEESWSPVAVDTEEAGWSGVAAGGAVSCALAADGTLSCWGSDATGQMGTGDREDRLTPSPATPGASWEALSLGQGHACGIDGTGRGWCWGLADVGQIGDGGVGHKAVPTRVEDAVAWSSDQQGTGAGGNLFGDHACGLTEGGALACWGSNRFGQVGDGSDEDTVLLPSIVSPGEAWTRVAAGDAHACALRADGSLWCWGHNGFGQIGDGTTEERPLPTRVGEDDDWVAVAAGSSHTCGLRADDTLWCWGRNASGELGIGGGEGPLEPVQVDPGGGGWRRIAAGGFHTCAVRLSGSLHCWGRNANGQVGDGSQTDRLEPVRVGEMEDWADFALGSAFTCGLRGAGEAWCWGQNNVGQLGDGTTTQRLTPVSVVADATWERITAGLLHACGVASDGALWCWGRNLEGQVGDGTPSISVVQPVAVGAAESWTAVSAGRLFTMGWRADGSRWVWGSNASDQHGDGSRLRLVPVEVLEPGEAP